MAQTFAKWKYALIVVVVALGIFLALPNIFGKSPAVQIQFADASTAENAISNIDTLFEKNNINYARIKSRGTDVEIIFKDVELQTTAQDVLDKAYPDANVAVNLLPNTPDWMQNIGLTPMNLGLDLRGGVSFLLQVDTKELFERRSTNLIDLSRNQLSESGITLAGAKEASNGGAVLSFENSEDRQKGMNAILPLLPQGVGYSMQDGSGGSQNLALSYSEDALDAEKMQAADQNRIRLSDRINSLGVAEPSVQVVGNDRILIELPGIQDVTEAKKLIGSTATLEFYLVDDTKSSYDLSNALKTGVAPFGTKLVYNSDKTQAALLKRNPIMSGEHIIDAAAGMAQAGSGSSGPIVSVVLDSLGGSQMAEITRQNLKKPMATVYVEYIPVNYVDKNGNEQTKVEKHERLVNQATIQGEFSNKFQITGVTPYKRAQELAQTLKSGSLVAPVYIIEEQTIGPSTGKQNIQQGVNASILGILLITIFILIYYGRLGFFADIALITNLVLLVALMSFIGATLTLPGIAGIILTLGMAIDANVLIYERIREELRREGCSVKESVRLGFSEALSTIVDANITTLIVAVVLFSFGVGPIKGFAVTLSIGILTSMFSAIFLTRGLIEFFLLRREQLKLKM